MCIYLHRGSTTACTSPIDSDTDEMELDSSNEGDDDNHFIRHLYNDDTNLMEKSVQYTLETSIKPGLVGVWIALTPDTVQSV